MIISFSGAQSTGKSTLLNKLKEDPEFKDWGFEPEITRSLKDKYNIPINEDGDDFTQLITVNSHIDTYLRHKNKNVVLDRCALDALVYTTYGVYTKKISPEVADYAEFVYFKIMPKYDIVFYTDPSIPLIDDGVRSINTEFRNKIIQLFDYYISETHMTNIVKLAGTIDERLAIIKQEILKRQK